MPLTHSGGDWIFTAFMGHNLWPLWWSISSYSDGFCSIIVHYGERWPHSHARNDWFQQHCITVKFSPDAERSQKRCKIKFCCFWQFIKGSSAARIMTLTTHLLWFVGEHACLFHCKTKSINFLFFLNIYCISLIFICINGWIIKRNRETGSASDYSGHWGTAVAVILPALSLAVSTNCR